MEDWLKSTGKGKGRECATVNTWGPEGNILIALKKINPKGISGQDQGRSLEAWTEAEPMEECCLLAYSLQLVQFTFLYIPVPEMAQPTIALALSH